MGRPSGDIAAIRVFKIPIDTGLPVCIASGAALNPVGWPDGGISYWFRRAMQSISILRPLRSTACTVVLAG
jgi:hypothetical protein